MVRISSERGIDVAGISDGRPQQKALEVRELILRELRADIVGPRGGPEEILPASENPLRGYLSGVLYPQRTPPDEEGDEGRADVQAGGGEDDGDAGDDVGAGAGVAYSATANPSSFGLACTVSPDAGMVRIKVEYGTYAEEERGGDGNSKARQYRRVQHAEEIDIPLEAGARATIPLKDRPEFKVRYAVRQGRRAQTRTLRVFFVNTNVHLGAELPGVSRCAFQPQIALSAPPTPPGGSLGARRIFVGQESGDISWTGGGASDSGDARDPDLALFEMLFRKEAHIATGRCCAVSWDQGEAAEHGAVSQLKTTFIPRYDVPHIGPRESRADYLDMETLYRAGMGDYSALLGPLPDEYDAWISTELEARAGLLPARHRDAAARQIGECRSALRRIRRGIGIVSTDPVAARAFSFANRAMHMQMSHAMWVRDKNAGRQVPARRPGPYECRWHLFQLAFFLLNIESITDSKSGDRGMADLLWFPTGGGKTEAYLGLIAFTLAHRRARKHKAAHLRYGTAVIMRYTLRLLTLQQFHRAALLMCACEFIRRHDAKGEWGDEPFLIGLWVGYSATPNTLQAAKEALADARFGSSPSTQNPIQIISCPWCGSAIGARDYSVSGMPMQCRVHCPNKHCDFSRGDAGGGGETGLPVLVVDEDIYRRCPSMVIGTVDKFAQATWKREAGAIFGRVDKYCQKHGFVVASLDAKYCGSHHSAKSFLLESCGPPHLDPPELIIQDELHLISGPLGTLTGIYETAIDALCTDRRGIRPKIVASTATAKKSSAQMRSVFDRRDSRVFPPQGLDFGESFFAMRIPPSERPGRAYVGVCITARSGPTVLGRLSAAVLRKARSLEEQASGAGPSRYDLKDIDSYHTLVAYFNTLRELGSANKMYDDTVPRLIQRIYANFEQDGSKAGDGSAGDGSGGEIAVGDGKSGDGKSGKRTYKDSLLEKRELTSRVDSGRIPDMLRDLETGIAGDAGSGKDGSNDAASGLSSSSGGIGGSSAVDLLLCTNMLSVGVDIPRLGMMIVNGQPKNHSEYIQATGRIGRASPGLVIANLNYFKPRDLSHYEDFVHYHSTLHKNVEPITVTPFSPRSRDRALFGVLVALVRHLDVRLSSNTDAGRLDPSTKYVADIIEKVRGIVESRAKGVEPGEIGGALKDADDLMQRWQDEAAGNLSLEYSMPRNPKARPRENVNYLMRSTGEDESRGRLEAPNSLRDAEPPVPIYYLDGMRAGRARGEGRA